MLKTNISPSIDKKFCREIHAINRDWILISGVLDHMKGFWAIRQRRMGPKGDHQCDLKGGHQCLFIYTKDSVLYIDR